MKKQTSKKLTTLTLILFSFSIFSQSKRVADRYFKEFAYFKSAKIYKAVFTKGDTSKYIVQRIGDSYYNNSKTEEAELWYKKLIEFYKETNPDYLFKYAQVLRSNGNVKKSDSIFLILNKNIKRKEAKKYIDKKKYLQDFLNNGHKKINIRNLAINTPFSDFGGYVLKGKVYFASSAPRGTKREKIYRWNNQPFLNIYKSEDYLNVLSESKNDTILDLKEKEILKKPVNTQFHESSAVFTKDGKFMYFTRVNFDGKKLRKDKKQTVNLKLYRAEKIDGAWSNILELPFNSNEYSVGHPALSPDEKTLYFASDMPGSIGKTDLFKVSIMAKNQYSIPENLGEKINTSEKEMFPFISEDNILFFSSDGHRGLGLLDIFQTKIYNDSTYSKVVNLNFPFNSKKDDFSFYVSNGIGNKGFFSSNRSKGKGDDDIYSFYITELPEVERCYQSVKGIVINEYTKAPIPNTVVKLIDKVSKIIINEALTDSRGLFTFDKLDCGEDVFTVVAEKKDYRSAAHKDFTLTKENKKVFDIDLVLDPLIVGDQIVIKPIYFDYNKSIIRDDAQYELENIVVVMNNHPKMIIKIESHTDSRGKKSYNRKLSDRRAKSTRDFIISRGIQSNRIISAIGHGEDQLLNKCNDANSRKCSEEEHQLNRRSYFYIVAGKNVKVDNVKPNVIDKKGYEDQKAILERLRKVRKINKNFRQRGFLRKKDKCYSDEEDCGKKGI